MKSIFTFLALLTSSFSFAGYGKITNISGIKAEHLYHTMSSIGSVAGLEGSEDCAMGTCEVVLKQVTCTKSFKGVTDDPRNTTEATLDCSIMSTAPGYSFVKLSYRDLADVSVFRRALIEVIGFRSKTADSNTVHAKSIRCTVHAMNREMDSLDVDTNYTCRISHSGN